MLRRLTASIPILVLSLLAFGCGGDGDGGGPQPIDHSIVETAVEASILKTQHLTSVVSCPADVQRKKGRRFLCIATLRDGSEEPINARVTTDAGAVSFDGLKDYVGGKRVSGP